MKEWLPVEEILAYPKYSDYYSLDDFDTIIDQVRKISEDIIAPTAEDADAIGAQWRDGQVYIPESFHKRFVSCMTMAGPPATMTKKPKAYFPWCCSTPWQKFRPLPTLPCLPIPQPEAA
jgi:hypothetical protein